MIVSFLITYKDWATKFNDFLMTLNTLFLMTHWNLVI